MTNTPNKGLDIFRKNLPESVRRVVDAASAAEAATSRIRQEQSAMKAELKDLENLPISETTEAEIGRLFELLREISHWNVL